MSVEVSQQPGVVIVAPRGRIDHGSADAFRDDLAPWLEGCREGGHAVLLDCRGLEYIASAGLRVLMLASRQTRTAGGRMLVAALQPVLAEIFTITRFDKVFPVFASADDALAALRAEAG